MAKDNWIKDTLRLGNQDIPILRGKMLVTELKFYPENPRIYSMVYLDGKKPDQKTIFRILKEMEHVKELRQEILLNGGLIDPVIVHGGSFEVVEGNSRLAACKLLASANPVKWGQIRVMKLPSNVDEGLIFKLLGEYHIHGKKDWDPYEQAGYLHRRNKRQGASVESLAKDLNLPIRSVNHLINVFEFMAQQEEVEPKRWSFYDEFLKANIFKKRRKENPKIDKVIVQKIRSGKIKRAVDVRDGLKKVFQTGGKNLTRFIAGKTSFTQACENAVNRGADNSWFKRLKKFRGLISEKGMVETIREMPTAQKDKCKYELKKISKLTGDLCKKL